MTERRTCEMSEIRRYVLQSIVAREGGRMWLTIGGDVGGGRRWHLSFAMIDG